MRNSGTWGVVAGKVLFFVPALYILAMMVWKYDGSSGGGMETYLLYMVLLTFPVGLLIPLMHVGLYRLFSIAVPATWMTLVLTWAALLLLGYLQWFLLLPHLAAKRKGIKRR